MINRTKESTKLTHKAQASFQLFIERLHQHWLDVVILTVLFIAAIVLAYKGTQLINAVILDEQARDVWFNADIDRVFRNMTDRGSNHARTRVHPLFSLIAYPPVKLLEQGLRLDSIAAVRAVIATVAATWIAAMFALLRVLGCRRADAVLFSLLAAISAASVFWFIVPETYQFGSLSILLALGFVALTEHRQFSSLWYIGVSALTLSITTTNWMAGLLLTIVNFSRKKALQITISTFCLVTLLWVGQNEIFPSAQFFLGIKGEGKHVVPLDPTGPIQVFNAFIAHTLVMPMINMTEDAQVTSRWPLLSVQSAIPGSGSLWGAIAVISWTALLGLGIWGFFSYKRHTKLRIVLALTLIGQLLLHTIYGFETFLYSLHFLPLLILLAAFSTFTRARPIALLLTGILIVTAGTNNFIQLSQATEVFNSNAPEQYQSLHKMQQTPQALWTPGTGTAIAISTPVREVDD